jgi:hypothetical protein
MYLEKIRGGAKFISCWLHIGGLEFCKEAQHIRCHCLIAATTWSQIWERNLLDKRARWPRGILRGLLLINNRWTSRYSMINRLLNDCMSTTSVTIHMLYQIPPHNYFLFSTVVPSCTNVSISRFHSQTCELFSVALTTGYCGKLSLGRSQSSCKISTLNYRQFFWT